MPDNSNERVFYDKGERTIIVYFAPNMSVRGKLEARLERIEVHPVSPAPGMQHHSYKDASKLFSLYANRKYVISEITKAREQPKKLAILMYNQ